MPLHLDYRPQTFEEVVGNKSITDSLTSILARKDKPHCYGFFGPKGCGKTTFARLLANGLGANPLEIHEYDTSNVRGIDSIQEIKQQSLYAPLSGRIRVNIFDEAHEITKHGAEAMLKFLEDTPTHIYNIFCTTNPEKIKDTIKRRLASYTVKTLLIQEMTKVLEWVLNSEGVTLNPKVSKTLIDASNGCPGLMLVKLDQIIGIRGEKDQLEAIENVTFEDVEIIDICRRLMERESGVKKWDGLSAMLRNFDKDPEQTRRAILGYLGNVLLGQKGEAGKRIALLISEFERPYYETGKAGLICSCYMACLV